MTYTPYTLYIGTIDDPPHPYRLRLYTEQRAGHWFAYGIDSAHATQTSNRLRVNASTPAEAVRECQKLFADRNLRLGKIAREYLEGKR